MAESKEEKINLDRILNQTFKHAKKLAREFYFKEWAKNSPSSPAFDGEVVHITHEGWEHIIDDTSRTRNDVMGRLFVLERAKKLLEETTAFQDYIERTDMKNKHEYWVLDGVIKDVKIRVVVRAIKDGTKHFLSVIKKGTIEKEIENDTNKPK